MADSLMEGGIESGNPLLANNGLGYFLFYFTLPRNTKPVPYKGSLYDTVRVYQTEVQLREWRIGNGSHGMGMKVSAREWRMRALEWKACNRMSFPHLEAIICI